MKQIVNDVMTKGVITLSANDTVREAARQMRDNNVGSVVVQDHGKISGIVTDRDIVVRCVALGNSCNDTPLGDICSAQVATLRPDDAVDHAIAMMRDRAIRRIPVVENGGTAVGILSLGDLAMERDPNSALGSISSASPNN